VSHTRRLTLPRHTVDTADLRLVVRVNLGDERGELGDLGNQRLTVVGQTVEDRGREGVVDRSLKRRTEDGTVFMM